MLASAHNPIPWGFWIASGLGLIALLGIAAYAIAALRRRLHTSAAPTEKPAPSFRPRDDNPNEFMTASMQAVIQKLREQEKELAQLHQLERERAQQTERLSEAVTRNMPAGLLIVGSSGLGTSANPPAEVALGVRALAVRRYTEVFGNESSLTKLLTVCLQEGRTFRREEIEYTTPDGDFRRLGVTISPILGNSGAT